MQNSSSLPCSAAITMPPPGAPFRRLPEYTLGGHLAQRLVEVGVNDIFSLAGDFNLTLLNHLIAHPELNSIACCNELNAGYAADGYARARGVGACVVTFTVGGLSLINAIAGAYSENIPVICIVGGPNSNDYRTKKVIHHSTGSSDFSQELRCFQAVTCYQAVINDLEDAHELIDTAISKALEESKPVYISISCNLAGIPHHSFYGKSIPFCLSSRVSNEMALEAAVEAASDFLNNAVKPVLVGGPMLRAANAGGAFANLADSCGYALAVMPSAKGLVREQNPRFIGTYWGAASTAFCAEVVESADAYLFAGPVFGDYITVGNTLLVKKEKAIVVGTDQVIIGHGAPYRNVLMRDFLERLAGKVKFNGGSYEIHRRIYVADGVSVERYRNEDLRLCVLMQHIQSLISRDVESTVIAETGGSWFNCQKLKLPHGCRYESQMQYGSVGWSVGATLGYAQAARGKRVVTCIGDGSFQVAAQEISTILCCGLNPIIILLNNGGYATSKAIQDGPYNVIRNWNHIGVVNAINNGRDKCWTSVVSTEAQLIEAFETAYGAKYECLCFIEVILHKDDTSRELLNWSSRVSAANNTPPNFH